jgi:hypothetical protein
VCSDFPWLNAKKKDSARLSVCGAFGDGDCGKDEERDSARLLHKNKVRKKG